MKIFLYLILAVLLLSILITPIVEVFMLGRDKILLSSTVHNSFRAAREASYSYLDMRNVDAVVDKEVFLRSFARTFATSYGMDYINPTSNPLRFVSYDETFNDFFVTIEFYEDTGTGDATITIVTITAESEYRFRTGYMRAIGMGSRNPYMLTISRTYTMRIEN